MNPPDEKIKNKLKQLEEQVESLSRQAAQLMISKQKYKTLVQELRDGIFTTDDKGLITFVNKALYAMLGYENESALIGKHFNMFVNSDITEMVMEQLKTATNRQEPTELIDIKLRRVDQTEIYVQLKYTPIIEKGKIQRAIAVVRDLTQEKNTEIALKENEEKYRHLFEMESDAIFLIDNETGQVLEANHSASTLYGYSREEFLKLKNVDISAEPDKTRHISEKKKNNTTIIPIRYHRKKNGTVFPVEITIRFFNWKNRQVHVSAMRDITDRIESQQELEKQRKDFQTIFDSVPAMIWHVDREHKHVRVNRCFCDSVGLSENEILGKTSRDLFPKLSDQFWKDESEILTTGKPKLSVIEQFPTSSKGVIWRKKDKIPYFDNNGNPSGIIGIAVDITDIKQAEDALKRSEENYRLLVKNQTDMLVKIDLDGKIRFASPSYCRLFGRPEQNLFGLTFVDEVHPDDRKATLNAIQKVYHPPFSAYVEQQAKTVYGMRWLAWVYTAIVNEEGLVDEIIGVGRDITDKKVAENAVSESEKKYRKLFENLMDAAFLSDRETFQIIDANKEAESLTGYTRAEIIGMHYKLLYSGEKEDEYFNLFKRASEKNRVKDINAQIRSKTGTIIPVSISTDVLPLGGREYVLALFRNMTEKKLLEEQLLQAQKMESIGTLAGGIAHDFNNLLMGIQGNASLALLNCDATHPHYDKLKNIEQLIQTGTSLTKQLLGFARKGKYRVQPTDLNDLLRRTWTLFGRTKKEINIQAKYQEDIWTVAVDQSQIEQTLINLFVNAWQAMPGGGDIYLETENVILEEAFAKSYGLTPGKYVKVAVIDTGIGMSDTIQTRIFDPFFTTKERERGTGLGLASAYGIIKNHNGAIKVKSRPNHGTRFDIYLPISDKTVEKFKSREEEIINGTGTILFVDDEDMIIDIGQRMLETLGYDVIVAKGGVEAVKLFKAHTRRIDMVILDMIMPIMSGEQTFVQLKDVRPDVKIMLLSGYSMDNNAKKLIDKGCVGFIQKPFNIRQLSKKLDRVFNPS